MAWPQLTGTNPDNLELQRKYNIVSPPKGFMIMNIFFQCVLGAACIVSPFYVPRRLRFKCSAADSRVFRRGALRISLGPDLSQILNTVSLQCPISRGFLFRQQALLF